jgi:hypothetical protein
VIAAIAVLARSVIAPAAASWGLIARPMRVVNIAVTMHAAALQGWWHFLCGRRDVVWQHDRSGGA